jgi:hypothetical protein
MQLSKKDKAKLAKAEEEASKSGVEPTGRTETVAPQSYQPEDSSKSLDHEPKREEIPREGMVCG